MMVEETVWEDHETCDHSYDKRCHKSYTTTYTPVQAGRHQPDNECFIFYCRRWNVTKSSVRFVISRWWTLLTMSALRSAGSPW